MHSLQPKHSKLKPEEVEELIKELNISVGQLPKIKTTDSCLPEKCARGDVVKIERKFDEKTRFYYRVVS
ncbi:DNA-directed RNA polymerase subunit H [Candidatus Pacearchaeota archaeon CG10_big_fil_rev_8_21_14_0_10_34_76]|nr:MAG: DNA-directed RNA polymerase subunit H [Candidatus Pacearchaeota archaeon CG10_big_fil_rev_8_21_14_0_10_34_76]